MSTTVRSSKRQAGLSPRPSWPERQLLQLKVWDLGESNISEQKLSGCHVASFLFSPIHVVKLVQLMLLANNMTLNTSTNTSVR